MSTFYGVWVGKTTGVFDTWAECSAQVNGFKGAQYKKIEAPTRAAAEELFKQGYSATGKAASSAPVSKVASGPKVAHALTVDGASNGINSEYQGVWYPSREKAFNSPVFQAGTNNIAEFLGLVHAIKVVKALQEKPVIYTDSMTAMAWVRNKKANTTADTTGKLTEELRHLIGDAELYLQQVDLSDISIQKWETKEWGEIPADFGRK